MGIAGFATNFFFLVITFKYFEINDIVYNCFDTGATSCHAPRSGARTVRSNNMKTTVEYCEASSFPRDEQGTVISQMKEHASTEIPNEDSTTMNCAIFTDLEYICNFIGVKEGIREERVYPALRFVGYNKCYHEFKTNGSDVFSDIAHFIEVGKLSLNPSKMSVAKACLPIFNDTHTKKYRAQKKVLAVAVEHANACGILTSSLNLYHTLRGLKYITENEPDYILLSDNPIFEDALRVLNRVDKNLLGRLSQLKSWMDVQ